MSALYRSFLIQLRVVRGIQVSRDRALMCGRGQF